MSVYQRMLRLGGYMNLAIAVAHLLMFAATKMVYRLLGSPVWMERMFVKGWGDWAQLFLTIVGVAGFVSLLGLYGLSGAGRIGRLPLLRTGLVLTSVIFLCRGSAIIGEVRRVLAAPSVLWGHAVMLSISLFALCIGILYAAGTLGLWKRLGSRTR